MSHQFVLSHWPVLPKKIVPSKGHNKTCNWQYKQNELDSRDTTHLTLFLQRYYFGNSNWELECFVIKLREFSSEEMIGH